MALIGEGGATPDRVHFKFQTAKLLSERQGKIALIAARAQRDPSVDIELQGYLDQREALNKYSWDGLAYGTRSDALSDLRARLVRKALIAPGLEKSRVRGSRRVRRRPRRAKTCRCLGPDQEQVATRGDLGTRSSLTGSRVADSP